MIEQYYNLLRRFLSLVQSKNFDSCLMGNENNELRFDFQLFFREDRDALIEEIASWPEWQSLQEAVTNAGGSNLHIYPIVAFQFSSILNEIIPPTFAQRLSFRNEFPALKDFGRHHNILEEALISGHTSATQKRDDHTIVLIQGLKLQSKVIVEGCGYFAPLEENVLNSPMFHFRRPSTSHLYSGFYIDKECTLDDDFVRILMTSLRLFKRGDIRYHSTVQGYDHFCGHITYQNYKNSFSDRDYYEETAFHGERAPTLMEISDSEVETLREHMHKLLVGLNKMPTSCDYYNRAVIAPKYMQIPYLFFALESLFPEKSDGITSRISMYTALILGKDKDFVTYMKKLYNVRSAIVHGDTKELETANRQLLATKYSKEMKNEAEDTQKIVERLLVKLSEEKWDPSKAKNVMLEKILV